MYKIKESERHLYPGAGFVVARFQNDNLVAVFDPMETIVTDDVEADAEQALNDAIAFAAEPGDYFTAIAGSYQLHELRSFDPLDASDLARFLRMAAEAFSQ